MHKITTFCDSQLLNVRVSRCTVYTYLLSLRAHVRSRSEYNCLSYPLLLQQFLFSLVIKQYFCSVFIVVVATNNKTRVRIRFYTRGGDEMWIQIVQLLCSFNQFLVCSPLFFEMRTTKILLKTNRIGGQTIVSWLLFPILVAIEVVSMFVFKTSRAINMNFRNWPHDESRAIFCLFAALYLAKPIKCASHFALHACAMWCF